MPQYKGDLKYPKPELTHDLAQYATSENFLCEICGTVEPKDVEAHRARFEPEAASQEQ